MAANTSPIFSLAPFGTGAQFTSTDTTTKKTLYTGGTNGSRIDQINVCTNDTAAVNLQFYLNDGTTDFYLGYVNIPAGSGYPSVAKVDALPTLCPNLGYLVLKSGAILKAACNATMTAAKTTDVCVIGGDF
jgi:hypothetical protein